MLESRQQEAQQAPASNAENAKIEKEALKLMEANQVYILLSQYIQTILDCYDPVSQIQAKTIVLQNFPFMDPKIQQLIKTAGEHYGTVRDNPFEDHNIKLLFSILGIKHQPVKRMSLTGTARNHHEHRAHHNDHAHGREHRHDAAQAQPQVPAQENARNGQGEQEQARPANVQPGAEDEAEQNNNAPQGQQPPRNNNGPVEEINRAVFK